jgi:hypothetical protein
LNNVFYWRLHQDVEKVYGADSMLVPVSEIKTRRIVRSETDLYQIAESASAVRQFGYWRADDDGYVPWLVQFRLRVSSLSQPDRQRIDGYLDATPQARRLAFTDVLAAVLPESRRAPLVLFLLFPLAVQIVTAMAFGDRPTAETLRSSQTDHLPITSACHQCHGRVLENGQSCSVCDNPLWKTDWLTSVE